MSDNIRISVDGVHGAIAARSAGIRLITPVQELALTGDDENRDGRPGINAVQATLGGPAGFLAVEISESCDIPQGIHVDVIEFKSRQEPPAFADIPAGRDVLLTAIGGHGEPGRNGGDGQDGMAGVDGAPATRESHARPGTDGGNGGDAGRGTNGADGGPGGEIRVYLHENNTHLLLATHHDISGGKGGVSGSHGRPGRGGHRGKGGAGYNWTEQVGYRYYCTSNCIGRLHQSVGTDLVWAGARIGSSTLELMAPIRAQVVQGGNLQAMIAQVAARHGVLAHRNVGTTGNCHCSGGRGNCVGCESEPVTAKFERTKGNDGRDGQPGAVISNRLVEGTSGKDGSFTIVVRSSDGGERSYPSRYNLELVDFDIEDENGDGIFEPGEHIMVKRIRIRNTGGMPSPTCPIPLSVVATDWLVPLIGDAGHAFIPPSINVGLTATVEGSIKALIRRKESPPEPGQIFSREEVLSITATMPWLDRELPHFEFRRTVVIQYPIELRQFKHLTTLAQGSKNRFAWEVYNKGARPLGSNTSSRRSIEIEVSFPHDCGNLLSSSNRWENRVVQHVPTVPNMGASPLQQTLQIFSNAKSYIHVLLRIELYILAPGQEQLTEGSLPEVCLVHTHDWRIQISSHHTFHPGSSILVVTNTETTSNKVQAVRNFIENEMMLQMDEWNVGLYGGLQYRPDEGELRSNSVFTAYQGKTIVFLGNRFTFFGDEPRRITELCDIRSLAEATCNGTTCLFLGLLGERSYDALLNGLIFPVPSEASGTAQLVRPSDQFTTKEGLADSVRQEKLFGSTNFALCTIPVQARWYRFGKASSKAEAKKLSTYMRRKLPQERFLITPVKIETDTTMADGGGFVSNGSPGECSQSSKKKQKVLAVLHGSSRQLSVCAIEESRYINATNMALPNVSSLKSNLDYFESYSIVASLPATRRVEMAWDTGVIMAEVETKRSTFALNAIVISLQRDINLEIQTFLREAGPQVPQSKDVEELKSYMRLHFPVLATLFQYHKATTEFKPPAPIVEVLHYAEASCLPQKKRHIAQAVLLPIGQRRSQLRNFIMGMVDELLMRKKFTTQEIKEFHYQTRMIHSNTDSSKRNTEDVIDQLAIEITEISKNAFKKGQKNATDVLPGTIFCTNDEWNAHFMAIETSAARMKADTEQAWEALGSMILPS